MPNSESSNRITNAQWLEANPLPKDASPDEVWKWMEADPSITKEQPPDDEAVTTVRFFGKKQAEGYKRQMKAAEAKKQRNK